MRSLYIVRHGIATSSQEDPERPLSEEGRIQVRKLTEFLQSRSLGVSVIWHSNKARARQTAEILSSAVKSQNGLLERDDLSPNDPVSDVARELNASDTNIMIVGHLPFVGDLVSELTGTVSSAGFRESTMACLERDDFGKWYITWMMHPGIV